MEADLAHYYRLDLVDFYRGLITPRKLEVLVRHLPRESAVVAAMNDGEPVWGYTEHLLADLWALLVKVNSDPKRNRDVDHPTREAMTAKARAKAKRSLKDFFLARKRAYTTEEVI